MPKILARAVKEVLTTTASRLPKNTASMVIHHGNSYKAESLEPRSMGQSVVQIDTTLVVILVEISSALEKK